MEPKLKNIFATAFTFFGLMLSPSLLLGADEKAAFDPSKATQGGLGMPTPYDKFLALDQALPKGKVNWSNVARALSKNIDPDEFKDKDISIPMALGVRIADGVMTVKAKDAEQLNKCAPDIEKLAQKLGIGDAEMGRARAVRTAANKGDWLKVFMELGFFQQDIMNKIAGDKNPARGPLLIASGWLEGARYTASIVEDNYTPALSNILREPLLVKSLRDQVAALPAATKTVPQVVKISEVLGKIFAIVDIPTDGSISKEDVAKIKSLATEVVDMAIRPVQ